VPPPVSHTHTHTHAHAHTHTHTHTLTHTHTHTHTGTVAYPGTASFLMLGAAIFSWAVLFVQCCCNADETCWQGSCKSNSYKAPTPNRNYTPAVVVNTAATTPMYLNTMEWKRVAQSSFKGSMAEPVRGGNRTDWD